MKMAVTGKILSFIFFFAASFVAACIIFAVSAEASQKHMTLNGSPAENGLLQFTSGKHILGFASGKAYLAGMDHALGVEFPGSNMVIPKSDRKISYENTLKALPMGKVTYENLWNGITLTYEAGKDGIAETVYRIAPGADVSKIRLKYNVPVTAQKDGSLRLEFKTGRMTESAPIAWQDIDGKRIPVQVAFSVTEKEVGFSVGQYDRRHALIIDPTYEWHTFYGNGEDVGPDTYIYSHGIAIDNSGNVYIAGESDKTWGSPLRAHSETGRCDNSDRCANMFILKLNSSGEYQWHTYYFTDYDIAYGVALDSNGNVYVTGYSLHSWGTPLHAHSGGMNNIVILKLNSDGQYQWHTYYGGNEDYGDGIAIDGNDNVYIIGSSWDSWGSPLHAHNGKHNCASLPYPCNNIVILKLNSEGEYQWHTFYGADDYGRAVALDNSGNVYVTGISDQAWGSPLNAHSGGMSNIIILKLNSEGEYQWHTFWGGNRDYGYGIAIDSVDNVYVTGTSSYPWGSPLNAHSGSDGDLFILKLSSSGTYRWHTYYVADFSSGIALDGSGNVYVSGTSWDTWGSPLHAHSGATDNLILKLDSSGNYQWHTYYGSSQGDMAYGIALDPSGSIYVTGDSWGIWNADGSVPPLGDIYSNNDYNIYVLKLSQSNYNLNVTSSGFGRGAVISSPAGINYAYPRHRAESASYIEGSNIVITAKAGAGSVVTCDGSCTAAGGAEAGNETGLATCTISNLSKAAAIKVKFKKQKVSILVSAEGNGKGSIISRPAGISYRYPELSVNAADFDYGARVEVTARASKYSTVSWNGTCLAAGGVPRKNGRERTTCTLRATNAAELKAGFSGIRSK
jgi:hypothetical protein